MKFSKIFTSKYLVLLFILFILFTTNVNGSTYYSIASGNWTSSSSWSLTSGGTAISTGYPGVGDDVIIEGNNTITISNGDALFANNITIGSTTNGILIYAGGGSATLIIANDLTIGGSTGGGELQYAWDGLTITCNRLLKGNASATRVNDYKQEFIFTGTFTMPSSFNVFKTIKINGGNVTLSNYLQINGTSPYIYAGSTLDLKSYNLDIVSGGVFFIYGTLIVGGPNNFPTGWTTLTIDPNSTVKYNYNGNKLIYPTKYGNLVIEGNGSYQSNRFIQSVTITNKGSNYNFDRGKRLTFSGGGGSGASAYITPEFLIPYGVRSVTLDNKGSGYTSTPTVSLTGTIGSGATFVANLSTDTYSALNTTFISLNISTPAATLTSCSGSSSSPTSFGVTGSGLTASVTITAPTDFEISTSSWGTYSSSLTLTNTSTVSQTLYVRLKESASEGSKTGTLTATSTGASDVTTTVSGTVNSIPSISITESDASGVSNNDGIICNGASATLTASGTTATYLWSTGESSTSITKSPSTSTTYTVTGTTSGCSNTASITITVNAIPSISITETDLSGSANDDSKVCKGGSATLTASGGFTYLWSTTATSSSIIPSLSSNTTYTVTGTSAAGCSNITSVIITVEALPTLSFSSISLCAEATYLITKTTSMPVDNGWSVSGTITINNGYITAGTTPGSYSVSYTDGCAQTASATVTVNNSDNGVSAITDGLASYIINNTNPLPQGPTASLYIGYNGFNYSSTTKPTNTGFYKANNQSINSAGCPYPFYIFRCTKCPD